MAPTADDFALVGALRADLFVLLLDYFEQEVAARLASECIAPVRAHVSEGNPIRRIRMRKPGRIGG